jgi:hypothetical protein
MKGIQMVSSPRGAHGLEVLEHCALLPVHERQQWRVEYIFCPNCVWIRIQCSDYGFDWNADWRDSGRI